MLVYGTQLVVLPFRKDTLTDEQEGGVGEGYACILLITVFFSPHSTINGDVLIPHWD